MRERYRGRGETHLAKRIIDQVKTGVLDPAAPQQDALAYLRAQMPEPESR